MIPYFNRAYVIISSRWCWSELCFNTKRNVKQYKRCELGQKQEKN